MQYMILNYVPAETYADAEAVAAAAGQEAWLAYTRALVEAGVLVAGNALYPAHTATTLRLRDGVPAIEDGPYAASKEQVGGYFVIDVPDLDTALHWARLNPAAASGAVEVRPVVPRAAG